MSKFLTIAAPLLALSALLTISSCKEDEPPAKPFVGFENNTRVVLESTGTVEIEVELDQPAPEDLTIEYTLSGTAYDLSNAPSAALADYEIEGESGELEIDAGDQSGFIVLNVYSDATWEDNETIIIELDDAGSNAQIDEDNATIEVTITNDDNKAVATMAAASVNVSESDGAEILEVTVNLNQPAPPNTIINYTVEGTALDSLTGTTEDLPPQYFDYYIDGTMGQLPIAAGATSGSIRIQLYSDFQWEDTETIVLTLAASGTGIELGSDIVTTVNVEQEDGTAILQEWEHTSVDLDLFLWIGNNLDNLVGPVASSAFAGKGPSAEGLFIPGGIGDFAFGLSHTYYEGTANPMNFQVSFLQFTDGVAEAESGWEVFNGSYTLANINQWDQTGTLEIEQTFLHEDGVGVTNISQITTPSSGSRRKTARMTKPYYKAEMRKAYIPASLR